MTSELANDPKRPPRDDDEADDESPEADEDDAARDRDERKFQHDLEIADEFEPTLDVPLPISDKPSRKRSRR
jgi:hypothetical protein